jgi:hypothetical protein
MMVIKCSWFRLVFSNKYHKNINPHTHSKLQSWKGFYPLLFGHPTSRSIIYNIVYQYIILSTCSTQEYSTYPFVRAQRVIGFVELLAGSELFTTSANALVVIYIVLPTATINKDNKQLQYRYSLNTYCLVWLVLGKLMFKKIKSKCKWHARNTYKIVYKHVTEHRNQLIKIWS